MKTLHPESVRVLRWVFQHNQQVVTCEIDASGDRAFDVCIVPHWNVSAAAIERFDAAYRAFERHAEVARRLHETGWVRATSSSVLQRRPSGQGGHRRPHAAHRTGGDGQCFDY